MSKVLILHHNDMDGRSGGFILYQYFSKFKAKEDIETLECGYTTKFFKNVLFHSINNIMCFTNI